MRSFGPRILALGLCVFPLALSACDDDSEPSVLHELLLESLEPFAVAGEVPPGVYLLDVEDLHEGRTVGTIEVAFLEVIGSKYELLYDPVPHLGVRASLIEIDLDTLEPPPSLPFQALDLGTLFGLGHSPDNPLVVEFLDATGAVLGAPIEYGYIPNNSAHPERIHPLRIDFSQAPVQPSTVRLRTPAQTFMPVVYLRLHRR